jgi:phage tail sheath protein FI
MAEYLSPAVYVEEIPSGNKPIQGVGTSTCGFVGHAVKGLVGEAVPLSSFAQYQSTFGGYFDNGFLTFAVKSFFDEGGTSCYVVRTCHYTPTGPTADPSTATLVAASDAGVEVLRVDASSPGEWGDDLSITVAHEDTDTFRLEVLENGNLAETYAGLSMDNTSDDYFVSRINGVSDLITLTDLAGVAADPRPAITATPTPLANGDDGLASLEAADYIGDAAAGNGLHALDPVEDVALAAVPEAVDRTVHVGGMAYCENRGDCFYIGFSQERPDTADDVIAYKSAQGAFSGGNAISSTYGALYTPWIQVFDPRTGGRTAIPPCGAVAGRYAAVDAARGVHKVAAGVTDGKIATALGVTTDFAFADQAKLNPKGINVIRTISGAGTVIWGARTVSSDPEWRYLNVRRLFLFLRGSIDGGTRWVVFEPNDRSLWNSIVRNVSAFLMLSWRDGALVGATPEQAFYVKCDEETNPQESIDLGRVITEMGVAPSKPAEFVVFRITQM